MSRLGGILQNHPELKQPYGAIFGAFDRGLPDLAPAPAEPARPVLTQVTGLTAPFREPGQKLELLVTRGQDGPIIGGIRVLNDGGSLRVTFTEPNGPEGSTGAPRPI